jgi:uncharacterized protein YecT (DUF1311 family)
MTLHRAILLVLLACVSCVQSAERQRATAGALLSDSEPPTPRDAAAVVSDANRRSDASAARTDGPTEADCADARAQVAAGAPGRNTLEINERAAAVLTVAQCRLSAVLTSARVAYAARPNVLARLDAVEGSWRRFDEAHEDELYPDPAPGAYGSVQDWCLLSIRSAAADERTATLQRWMTTSASCSESAGSDAGAAEESARATEGAAKADRELNDVYRRVVASYAQESPPFVAMLRKAEVAWLRLRDADVALVAEMAGRTPTSACAQRELERVVRVRTEQLRVWLSGVEQGDVCAGSRRVNP